MGLWSDRARPIIRAVLDALPVDANHGDCRLALRDAYPFGERAMHPYKVWQKECKAALARRFAEKATPAGVPTIELVIQRRPGRLWLTVRCGWHSGTGLQACVSCNRHHAQVAELVANAQFVGLLRAGASDPVAAVAAQDWLEEHAGCRPEVPPPEVRPRPKKKEAPK